MSQIIKPEVLAPAGDFERLKYAIQYGADAVYLGGTKFGMRAASANFDFDTLKKSVDYAHSKGKKIYLTCNTVPTNEEVKELEEYLKNAAKTGVDAFIIADIGVMMTAKRVAPEVDIHISTQTGIMNYVTATELYNMGAKRVVLAREVPIEDIKKIRDNTPPDLEIEAFVHGAMCMSFSGRCLISNFMVGRDANRGECAQPCRWGYHLMEEKRPGQYYPVFEDEKGSYILNAKDMSMIEHIDKVVDAGVTSLKIEGRAKSFYYVSVIANAYRCCVDEYVKNPKEYTTPKWLVEETYKVSHREYSTGFYFGKPDQCYESGGYVREFDVIATVENSGDGYLDLVVRNKFTKGEKAQIISPKQKPVDIVIGEIIDPDEGSVESACHPMKKVKLVCDSSFPKGAILRRERPSAE